MLMCKLYLNSRYVFLIACLIPYFNLYSRPAEKKGIPDIDIIQDNSNVFTVQTVLNNPYTYLTSMSDLQYYDVKESGFAEQPNAGVITVKAKAISYLYGTKASAKAGKAKKENGDFFTLGGPFNMEWSINVMELGEYEVQLCYGASADSLTNYTIIRTNNSELKYKIVATNGVWGSGTFITVPVSGTVKLQKGLQTISLKVENSSNGDIMRFRSLELIPVKYKGQIQNEKQKALNSRAKTDWLNQAGYGVMFHWTSQSVNQDGSNKPYEQAVNDFDVGKFANMVEDTGAGYVIFTIGHAEPYCPAPLKSWEKYHPEHTTKRDLIAEMANALNAKNIKLICYFPTHIIGKYRKVGEKEFTKINNEVMTEFGKRYGKKVAGYWFDGWYQCFEEYPDFSFKNFFKACKAGNQDRIIALNSWIYPAMTEWQEYWAGEAASPVAPPEAGTLKRGPGKGLQYQALIIMEPYWVQEKPEIPDPRFNVEQLSKYIRECMENGGAVTINMGIYQDGTVGKKALQVMKGVRERIRK